MPVSLNQAWVSEQVTMINDAVLSREIYNVVLSFSKAKTRIVTELTKRNIPFKLYNLGAGVVRITTDTDKCPCCKRKL